MNAPVSKHTPSRIPLFLLALLLLGYGAYVNFESTNLPTVVATHFDLQGRANGWMPRQKHLWFCLAVGMVTPLFIVSVFAFVRRRNGWGLNIPNKAYWLDPERKDATFDYLSNQGIWLSALIVVFQAAIFRTVLDANRVRPPVLAVEQSNHLAIGFTALVLIWIAGMYVRFLRPKP